MIQLLLQDPILLLIALPVLLLSLTLHEVSHGYAALKCGDTTARDMGRLSLNPLAHLDLYGTLAMLLIGFGWAKPVPVNFRNLRKPRRDIAIVSIAGPLANILLCFVAVLLYFICLAIFSTSAGEEAHGFVVELLSQNEIFGNLMLYDQASVYSELMSEYAGVSFAPLQYTLLQAFALTAQLNAGLAIFNLIPLPPLDGSKILACLLPAAAAAKYLRIERYVRYIVIGICVVNLLGNYIPPVAIISEILLLPVTLLRSGLLWLFGLLGRAIFMLL